MARTRAFRLVLPSTRAFYRESRRTPGTSIVDFLHGYVYARWPYFYIGSATGSRPIPFFLRPVVRLGAWMLGHTRRGETPGRNAFADRYHGKVVSLDFAERLVTLDVDIDLRGLEQIVPYPIARDIVLSHPEHIVALECPCRAGREHPCLPLDVCLIVGEPFASFVADHHPDRARWITQSEAVEILRAEHERGHVHHAFFKDATLGRFYAICNCCSCCCGAMQAFRQGVPMLVSSGYVARSVADRCAACGACTRACPFGALSLVGSTLQIDAARCMGCGVCVATCPRG
ncbi:MAG: 4Fe-4S binding protein, partial [Candidatus Bipolaricaulota bacterium]|nr:4Fe-4S binding protein [Candidatus Bipolaricaulota bacterium]